MKTTVRLLLGLALPFLVAACNTAESRWRAADRRTQNEFLIQQYMLDCVAAGQVFPVFHLGLPNVQEYFDKYPELKQAREEFERENADLVVVLMKDPEYRANRAWYDSVPPTQRRLEEWQRRNAPVYDRLKRTSREYLLARDKRDRALYRSNMLTIERILNDSRAENRILPVEWIGRDRIGDYIKRF